MFLSLSIADALAADVVVIHTDSYFADDVVRKLVDSRAFATVDTMNVKISLPEPFELAAYDAILVYTNVPISDPGLMGDRLADYVDDGGGVVECIFANVTYDGVAAPLLGRFHAEGYDPLWGENLSDGSPASLTVLDPDHPVMLGVTALEKGPLSYHGVDVVLAPTATSVGVWDDGEVAVAVDASHVGNIVGLNLFPPSDDVSPNGWDASTDGATLLANALQWAIGPDFDADAVLDKYDNCVSVPNDQADVDGDTVGDACDQCAAPASDADVDGICDDVDACVGFDDWYDPDGDGAATGCDPCPYDGPDDPDSDGWCTSVDPCFGLPNLDDDEDAVCDSLDVCAGQDDLADADADGVPDGCDCGPTEAAVYGGAPDVCDGLDNDCDGVTDPENAPGTVTYYFDLDGDGYGADASAVGACFPPLNYVSVGGDCDDDAIGVNPGADELCNGLDDDCDGAVDLACADDEEPGGASACGCAGGGASGSAAGLLVLAAALVRRRRA